jgi:signal transduction histidine kinase/phage shock protein PspC (stress-responsive transcriptional regulator)
MASTATPTALQGRSARRPLLLGVCVWLGRRWDVDPLILRAGFVIATVAGGFGVPVYVIAALLMPADQVRGLNRRRTPRAAVEVGLGAGLLVLAGLLTLRALDLWVSDAVTWPVVLVAAGGGLIWRTSQSSPPPQPADALSAPEDPRPRRPGAAPSVAARPGAAAAAQAEGLARGRAGWAAGAISRTSVGIALVVAAAFVFLQATGALSAARDVGLAALVVAVALGIIFAPWILRLVRSLDAERAARIRSQERAEVAAHLHDSVLQTLALVQKRSDDPRAVATLARRQERELRAWLSGRRDEDGAPRRLRSALETVAEEVEVEHGATVDVIAVGDRDLDERGAALVAAAREAMLNAARHGGGRVSVYAEASDDGATVFVRDRGPGFERSRVPADRRGIAESIVGRMRRHGGRAEIRTAPGEGTEVELSV